MWKNLTTEHLIELLRGRLAEMVDDKKRHELLNLVTDGWCRYCGSEEPKDASGYTRFCQCMNDE